MATPVAGGEEEVSLQVEKPKVVEVAWKKRGGYECEFIERPPKAFQVDCPICLLVLREPYQATCCGYSFCKTCIERVRAGNAPACPKCKRENFTIYPNIGQQRALNEYNVRCTPRERGCEWMGELGELDKHLNETPDFGKQLEGCQFAEIECIHCGEPFQRRLVKAHQNDKCPRRPFSCDYCQDYGADYEDVVNKHWPVCPCYPMPCPNECEVCHLERQNLEQHVSKECPLALVDCDFHYAGCEVKLLRKDMSVHLEQSLVTHVSLLAVHNHNMSVKFQAEKDELKLELEQRQGESEALKQEIAQLKQKQVESEALKQEFARLKQKEIESETQLKHKTEALTQEVVQLKQRQEESQKEIARLKHNQEELQSYTGVLPVEFTMTDFEQHKKDGDRWFSPPFYTHPYGYKMCLGVNASGSAIDTGTHVSVFAYLMRGKFDDSLLWPFQGYITLQLCNQLEDKEHLRKTWISDRESVCRVTTGERAGRTRGSYRFISHGDLGHNPAKNCQYLKDDCLHFRVMNVSNVNLTFQHETQLLLIEPRVSVVPLEFVVTDYNQYKREDTCWISPAFYTHPQGYRICLEVCFNGYLGVSSRGTHISVFVHLMQGQYDSSLKWPFRGDITVQLLNQLRDRNHYTETTSYTDQTPSIITGRVTRGTRALGWGWNEFISHSELDHNPAKKCQYLKDDCLHFRASKVNLK